MPKTIAKFKCNICEDIFTATSEDYTSCKCEKCCVKPNEISTSYKSDNRRGLNFIRLSNEWDKNIINDITYYYKDDFYIMDGDILNLFNEVKALCEELGFHIYEHFEKDESGNKYLDYISYTISEPINKYSNEVNQIDFTKRFNKEYVDEEQFKNRLLKFKEFLIKIKNNNINIANRNQMTSDELDLEYDSQQLKKYDYTFYF